MFLSLRGSALGVVVNSSLVMPVLHIGVLFLIPASWDTACDGSSPWILAIYVEDSD